MNIMKKGINNMRMRKKHHNRREPTNLEIEIEAIYKEMQQYDRTSKEYAFLVKQLESLEKLKQDTHRAHVKPDTWVMAGANLAGIALILRYEQVAAITSKAVSFVTKIKF